MLPLIISTKKGPPPHGRGPQCCDETGAFCKSHDSGAGNRAQNKSQSHPVLLKEAAAGLRCAYQICAIPRAASKPLLDVVSPAFE